MKGIITKGVGGLYTVRPLYRDGVTDEEYLCRARGAFRHGGVTPVPGDIVEAELSGETDEKSGAAGVIYRVYPRINCMIRPPMANLTHMLVTVPAASPKPDLLYVDKLTAIADANGIDCTVIVNKCDLDPSFAEEIAGEYASAGFRVFKTDALSGEGCDAVVEWLWSVAGDASAVGGVFSDEMPDETESGFAIAALAGASGAGKSSLTGRLFPNLSPEVGQVSRKTERGRHTTRAVEVYPVGCMSETGEAGGLFIADTPGFSMLDFKRFDFFAPERLPFAFREFLPHLERCRYTDCTHTKEEDCAVLEAVERGEISRRRHGSYLQLYMDMKEKPDWQRRQEKENG